MSHPEVEQLVPLLAQSFYDDPVSVWVVPEDDHRLASLEAQFTALYTHVFVHRRVVDVAGDPPLAQAVWAPPTTWQLTESEEVAVGTDLISVLGDRIARVGAAFEAVDARHPSEPHWYLEFLGVAPIAQGLGHGGRLLAEGLRRCDEAQQPAYLWTGKERNLNLYANAGFEVIWEDRIEDGPQVWGLWRTARTT